MRSPGGRGSQVRGWGWVPNARYPAYPRSYPPPDTSGKALGYNTMSAPRIKLEADQYGSA